MDPVVVLFVRADSIYKTLPGVDCYDAERDARTWPGGCSVVAHPPCRGWGRLAHMSNATEDEKALGPWAVAQVQRWGGVLEHPEHSRLWKSCPNMAQIGFTLRVRQCRWGHRATKPTWLYVCGCRPEDVPPIPNGPDEGTHYLAQDRRRNVRSVNAAKPRLPDREREATPPAFAVWLVELARRCGKHNSAISLKVEVNAPRDGNGDAMLDASATKETALCSR